MRLTPLLMCLAVAVPASAQELAPETDLASPEGPPAVIEALLARVAALEVRDTEQALELARAAARRDTLARERAALAAERAAALRLRPIASFFTRGEHRVGFDTVGARGSGCVPSDHSCLRFRARLGLETSRIHVADGVRARLRFTPQAHGAWTNGSVHPTVGLFEGYLALHFEDDARLEVGRFAMSYGDQKVIGVANWGPAGRSFDGLRLRLGGTDSATVDLFWTMQLDALQSHTEGDSYFYGTYVALGPVLGVGSLDLYALVKQRHDSLDPETGALLPFDVRGTIGGRFRHRIGAVDLGVWAGLQAGARGDAPNQPVTVLAGQAEGEVGINALDDRMRVAVRGTFASGDGPSQRMDNAYDHLFPTGHAMLGLADVIGPRRNVIAGALRVSGAPLSQLALTMDLHAFARPYRPEGDDQAFVGYELDLQALWRPGDGLQLRAVYGIFEPFGARLGAPLVHYAEVEVGYRLD